MEPMSRGVTDPMLTAALDMVEHGAPAFPVTLAVSGIIVTGFLCSRSEFEVEIEASMDRNPPRSGDRDVMPVFYDRTRAIEVEQRIADQFVHMKDCCLTSGGFVFTLSTPWRGKLSSVDGFSFGKFVLPVGEN